MDRKITRRILDYTLEILFLLTGEEYTVVKTAAVTPIIHLQESGGWSPITAHPPHSLIQKVLELTNKMAELLTGEVPIRCQDVAVYFSMEEWEYLEGHRDLYKDIMMEEQRLLISPAEAKRRKPPERCPSRLFSQDRTEDGVPGNQQGDNLMDIKVEVKDEAEEPDIRADQQNGSSSRSPPESCPSRLYSQDRPEEDVPENQQGGNLMDIKVEVKDEAEESDIRADQQDGLIERNPPERCPSHLYSQACPKEDISDYQQGDNLMDIKVEVKEEAEEPDIRADRQYGLVERNPPDRCPSCLYSQDHPEEDVPENQQMRLLLINDPPGMDRDRRNTAAGILDVTLDMIHLITGEEYTVVKTASVAPSIHLQESGGWSPITAHPTHFLIQKVLELTNKMAELLTGEVPIRCQDVVVYLSMEEWTYLEGHQNLHKNIMMEDRRPRTSLGNPSKKSMLSVNYKVEDEDIVQCSSGKNLITLNVHPGLHSTDPSYNLPNPEKPSPHQSQITISVVQKKGKTFHHAESGKQFAKSLSLTIHQRRRTKKKTYSCSICGKYFTQKSNVVTHERIHTGEKPFSCSECGKCFITKRKLEEHQRIHTGEKPYSCSECGKCFRGRTSFVTHKRSHTGEKPFSCSECAKCFITRGKLDEHQRIHTGEKPYACSECGKGFTGKTNLLTHERIHTGEKPFSCSECGKHFISKSNLEDHQRIHTGEKPFTCSECGKYFVAKSRLITHKRVHTGEKPYSCAVCGKCFTQKSNLVKHEKIHAEKKMYS